MDEQNAMGKFLQSPIGRRNFLKQAAVAGGAGVGLSALLAACGSTPAAAAGSEGNFPSHPQYNFVFVNHVTTNPFFTATQYGIQDAAALLGCKFQWTGSENSVVSDMVNAINTAVANKVDGIATTIVDPTAFNAPIAAAIQAGIPVVAYNADAPASSNNKRFAYIGQDLYQSGVELGNRIVQLVGSGDVVGFIATPGQLNIQPRIDGAKAAIQASGAPINFVEVTSGPTVDGELSIIDAYWTGHSSNLKGMFAVDAGSTQGVAQTSKKYNLPSMGVHTGGFDLLPLTLQLIQEGFCDFTIDQQPYLQGMYPMMQLFMYKLSGGLMFPCDTDTGLLFVTKSNVGLYLNTTSRFEGSSSAEKVISGS